MPNFCFINFWSNIDNLEKNFIMNLFSDENNVETNYNKADYIISSVFDKNSINYSILPNQKLIHISFEPLIKQHPRQNLIISTVESNDSRVYHFSFGLYYIYLRNLSNRLLEPKKITQIPTKFCCFLSSSGYGLPREREFFFTQLSKYKKIDSWGSHLNNMGKKLSVNYYSQEFLDFIGQYKFMISFENKKINGYFTEKIFNPILAGIIPIYWGDKTVFNIVNKERVIYLKEISDINNIIQEIIEIDKSDLKYIDKVNNQIIVNNNLVELNTIKKEIRNKLI